MPSASPSYHPALVAVDGNAFELRMTPVNTYLYVDAFNELNSVFDELIKSNLDLILPDSSAVIDLQLSTVMSSQGLKRRDLREENGIEVEENDDDLETVDEEIFDILRSEDRLEDTRRFNLAPKNYEMGNDGGTDNSLDEQPSELGQYCM